MNPHVGFVPNKQFWAGVAVTIVVGILGVMGVPNLLRTRKSLSEAKRPTYQMRERLPQAGGAGYGGGETLTMVSSIAGSDEERRMIRTSSMDLIVKSPREMSEKIRLLAEQSGGFLTNSETYGGENAASASLTIRIPVGKFEQIRAEIRNLGRVESEKLEAQDVTKQYVDQAARLRNFRAQETQYLGILKQARTVKDTLEVSDKLNEVRGEIEQRQAEFDALSKQVETVALTISLRAEADAQVFGLHWRPLYQLKLAARDGIDGIGDYAAAMAAFIFYIPAILLWVATIVIGAAVAWRILRWVWRVLFAQQKRTT